MPIGGVTDQGAGYPRLGILRKGSPKRKMKRQGKEIEIVGTDLDHFRFVTDNLTAMKAFTEAYGEAPRAINVMLPYGTKDENLDAWMKEYGAGSLKVKCSRPDDGIDGIVLWQDENGVFQSRPKDCQWPNCDCKPHGVLTVIIPELVAVAGVGLVWVLTTSWNDCSELSRNLEAAEGTARRLGTDLRGIPFVLSRQLDTVSCPPRKGSNGKRVRDEKWMLHIEPHPNWVASQMIGGFKRLAEPVSLQALPAGPDAFDEVFFDDEGEPEDMIEEVFEPAPEPEPNGDEQAKIAFFASILDKIPYYTSNRQAGQVLLNAGFTEYDQAKEVEMLEVLEKHANEAANKEAA